MMKDSISTYHVRKQGTAVPFRGFVGKRSKKRPKIGLIFFNI